MAADLRGSDLTLSQDDDPIVTWMRYRVFLQGVLDGGICDEWQLAKAVGLF